MTKKRLIGIIYLNCENIRNINIRMCSNVQHLNFAQTNRFTTMEVARSKRRNSYAREFNISVVKWYYKNGKNILHTSQKFQVDRKQIRSWIKTEDE